MYWNKDTSGFRAEFPPPNLPIQTKELKAFSAPGKQQNETIPIVVFQIGQVTICPKLAWEFDMALPLGAQWTQEWRSHLFCLFGFIESLRPSSMCQWHFCKKVLSGVEGLRVHYMEL